MVRRLGCEEIQGIQLLKVNRIMHELMILEMFYCLKLEKNVECSNTCLIINK
jgi:hypothetical protein